MIAERVARLRREFGGEVDPARRGPVDLHRYFAELSLAHVALPGLTVGRVREHLLSEGTRVGDIGDPATPLAGFLFVAGRIGTAFVTADDPLPRRRFSAAHELGHAVLHRESMGDFLADETIDGGEEGNTQREREANAFAAELLMPAEVCRARAAEMTHDHGACPRGVLAYRLASELLVSREAMRYRLKSLGVGDGE